MDPYATELLPIGGDRIAVHRQGAGPPLVLLHGNPTSSYLWRFVVPALATSRTCIAVDLPGFGASSMPAQPLGVVQLGPRLDTLLEMLDVLGAPILGHDWGGVLALDHAARHPEYRTPVAVCESHLRPIASWADTDDGFRDLFTRLRASGTGEHLVIDENLFIEGVLLGSLPWLPAADRAAYRAPFADPSRRAAILRLVREIPIGGEPGDVVEVMDRIAGLLADPSSRQLVLSADPGSVITAPTLAWLHETARGVDVVDVGPGEHFVPEQRPAEIAAAVGSWLTSLS